MGLLKILFCDMGLHFHRATTNKEYRESGNNYVCRVCGHGRKVKPWLCF